MPETGTPEPPPTGSTASILRESRRVGESLGLNHPNVAARWMIFTVICAVLGLAGWLGIRSITSFETVISMILRSKEDQAERDRQFYATESEKVRTHCSRETELAAKRETERTDGTAKREADRTAATTLLYVEQRDKDRLSGEIRDRMVRDELIAIRILLGKMKLPVPPDEEKCENWPVPGPIASLLYADSGRTDVAPPPRPVIAGQSRNNP